VRDVREHQTDGERDRELHSGAGVDLREPATQPRRRHLAEHERTGEEPERLQHRHADACRVHRPARRDRRHHRKDDQAEDVVDHGRAEDDLRLRALQDAGVAEDAAGDAHRGRGERRAEEEVGGVRQAGQQPGAHDPGPERERHHDADRRDPERARADAPHRTHV
jgi:hypothetical protein